MKEMTIEKIIDLHREFDTIQDCTCLCKLTYLAEETGIRATGGIQVKGNALHNNMNHEFLEEIELDILAPYDKLDGANAFRVDLNDYDYKLNRNKMELVLMFALTGLREDEIEPNIDEEFDRFEDEVRFEEFNEEIQPQYDNVFPDVFDNTPKSTYEDMPIVEPEIIKHQEEINPVEPETIKHHEEINVNQVESDVNEEATIEDLLDDSDNIMAVSSYIIAQNGDTYSSLAAKYNVDERKLINSNQNRIITKGLVLLVPRN